MLVPSNGTWIFRFPVRYLYLFATWPFRYLPFRYREISLNRVTLGFRKDQYTFATCSFRYPDFFKSTLEKQ